jgi:tetratricopeptide (TPR) repeat protein
LNIGLVNYRRGDYSAAIPALSSVLRDQPDSEQARYLLGLCNLFTEHYADAVSMLEPLWPKKSDDFMYLYVLSLVANRAGQKELDQRALARLVEVGEDRPEFHLLLGKAYLNHQESQKAIIELERAASQNMNLPFVHLNLGVAYTQLGDNRPAEEEFRKDIGIEPDVPDTYELLGEFYMRDGKDDEAERNYQEALRRNPRMPASLFGLAKIYFQRERYEQALATIDAALRLAPSAQYVHFLRGRILMKLGRREEAQAEFTSAQESMNSVLNKEREAFEENRVPNPELRQEP